MRNGHARITILAAAAIAAMVTQGIAGAPASAVFVAERTPSSGPAQPFGSYAKGCLAGAVALPETGTHWQAMRLSRHRNWGHPAMIAFIERLAGKATAYGWPRLLVGDIGLPRGGPMPTGHRSHQIGLDADIWLSIPGPAPLSVAARESVGSPSLVRPGWTGLTQGWRPEHAALIRLAAEDPAVARIFVNPAIKRALCEGTPAGERAWLHKVRPWWGHDEHIHVRLDCPPGAQGCVDQDPIPPGEGCDASLAWWFTDEALHPKPPAHPPAAITLDDLPPACREKVLR